MKNKGTGSGVGASGEGTGSPKSSTDEPTTTKVNGGPRSSPPRVAGNGMGEAEDTKSKAASVASKAAAKPAGNAGSATGGSKKGTAVK